MSAIQQCHSIIKGASMTIKINMWKAVLNYISDYCIKLLTGPQPHTWVYVMMTPINTDTMMNYINRRILSILADIEALKNKLNIETFDIEDLKTLTEKVEIKFLRLATELSEIEECRISREFRSFLSILDWWLLGGRQH